MKPGCAIGQHGARQAGRSGRADRGAARAPHRRGCAGRIRRRAATGFSDPLHELHELHEHNVTLTPHSAWQSPWTWVRDRDGIWLNVIRMLRGEPIEYLVMAMSDIRFGFCVPNFAFPGIGLFRTPGFAALDPATTIGAWARRRRWVTICCGWRII